MEKHCNHCKTIFDALNGYFKYCSDVRRSTARSVKLFNNKQKKLLEGIEGIDYVIDLWNGLATLRIYGKWIASQHPGRTTKEYLEEFPNASLCCLNDKKATAQGAKHMRTQYHRDRQSKLMSGSNNINHTSKTTSEIRQSRSPFSLNFAKYSNQDEARVFQKQYCSKGIKSNTLQYWLNKGHSPKIAKKLLSMRQATFSLKSCISKHGIEEGTEIFNDRQKKWLTSLHKNFEKYGDGRSPSSKFANSIIKILCEKLEIPIPEKEKWIRDSDTNKAYSYDFTYNNKIIEFNGDYWHCNPLVYDAEYLMKTKNMLAQDIWEYDIQKIKLANAYNYEVLTIWESDWNLKPSTVIEKCLTYLDNG